MQQTAKRGQHRAGKNQMRKVLITLAVTASALILVCFLSIFFFIDWDEDRVDFIDLSKPVYFVTDNSLWSGCKDDPAGYEACCAFRVKQINNGLNDWFDHFDEATRPKAIIVFSATELPDNTENNPIYIKIKPGYCGMATSTEKAVACYSYRSSAMIFDSAGEVTSSTTAHEFGHGLGRGHKDTPKNIYSVMSYTDKTNSVVPIDIKILCKMHPECPPHEDTWCKGGFWDNDRCPSDSYEEGETMFQIDQIMRW